MNKHYIRAWLSDQIDDSIYEFPEDFDFDLAVDWLNEWFDDQIVCDHLDSLLLKLFEEKINQ